MRETEYRKRKNYYEQFVKRMVLDGATLSEIVRHFCGKKDANQIRCMIQGIARKEQIVFWWEKAKMKGRMNERDNKND